ncbi:short chain oxidoreductase CsgA [Aspergillus sclerotialis]|uniref:Short chain oxidoreductase CsgA n=1 Tax=Aspergillus sclerotialis TaxID=2070753 RepID=A0A3A2ZLR9_9EURO|nr:short chain oxidoreductase CsgA [Aspergillus sclerotialis]
MASYLITGTSRGIGLAMADMLATKPASEISVIFAAARTETDELKQLVVKADGRVKLIKIDVTDESSAKAAAGEVGKLLNGNGLDVLVNNVGIINFTPDGIENMTDLESSFTTNVTSTHLVTSAFLPLLKKGSLKKVVNISTTLGSIKMSPTYSLFPVPAYKISKAALNMLTVQYALSFKDQGFTFLAISPGWVRTNLGGKTADLSVEQSSQAVLDIIFRATTAENGKFFNVRVPGWEKAEGLNQYDGAEVPW